MLVRTFLDKMIDTLRATMLIEPVSQLPAVSAKAVAQLARLRAHTRPGLVVMYRQRFECLARASLGDLSRLDHDTFKFSPIFSR
jgi:hypothetical protein